jgi:hypothetical protein
MISGTDRHLSEIPKPPPGARFIHSGKDFEVAVPVRTHWAWVFMAVFLGMLFLSALLWKSTIHGDHQPEFGRYATGATAFAVSCLALLFLGVFALHYFGRVAVAVRGDVGELFIGIGPLGRRQLFCWGQTISILDESVWDDGNLWYRIRIRADRILTIQLMMESRSREYLLEVLGEMLRQAGPLGDHT